MRDPWCITTTIESLRKQREEFPTIRLVTGASFGGSSLGSLLASTDRDVVVMHIDGIGKQEFTGQQWNSAINNTLRRSGHNSLNLRDLNQISMRTLKILFDELKKSLQEVDPIQEEPII